jgi:hypothetical protein
VSCRNRLGELPRACSLTDYPSKLSKTGDPRTGRSRIGISVESPESSRSETSSEHPTLEVELMGIEPTTSGLQNRRSPS